MALKKRILIYTVSAVILVGLLVGINAGYYLGTAYSGEFCANCHVIRPSVASFKSSSHRNISCEACHGSAFTFNLSVHATHWRRVSIQLFGDEPDRIILKDKHIDQVVESCKGCHENSYAQWQSGGHSMTFGDVFLNEEQNRADLLNNDCMRCHGMFFEGDIFEIVLPVDREGPWRENTSGISTRAAIPCLSCHQMHREGTPAVPPDYARPEQIAHNRDRKTSSLAFYDRRDAVYIPPEQLPLPKMLEAGRKVAMSPDVRQALCYQCHAPEAHLEIGTGDDRTCIGVHEGISCMGCHLPHSQDARASCDTCHPKMSNCGLDVEKMDTTFLNPNSRHNIHTVKCADCHVGGVPEVRKENILSSLTTR